VKVVEQVEVGIDWTDANLLHEHPYPTHKRSAGLHLTDILRQIAIQTGMLTDEEQADLMPLRMFLGMAWEQMCVRLYPEIWWQPGEVERDGVVGSPDGYSCTFQTDDDNEGVIEEWKYTAKSMRIKGGSAGSHKDVTTETLWMWQVMGYCAMHPCRPTLARMHVCWTNGDYTYPLTPRYIRYLVRLEESEIENVWKMVVSNRHLVAGGSV